MSYLVYRKFKREIEGASTVEELGALEREVENAHLLRQLVDCDAFNLKCLALTAWARLRKAELAA